MHAPLGMYPEPDVGSRGDRTKPLYARCHAQARVIDMHHRCMHALHDSLPRGRQRLRRLMHPLHQRGRRNVQPLQVLDEFARARKGQELALRQMHRQRLHVRAVLRDFTHLG